MVVVVVVVNNPGLEQISEIEKIIKMKTNL
jgi:hypothetical protein